MNSSYFNAAAGAFLAVVFVVMTVSIAGDAIFHSEAPENEGYELVALEGSGTPSPTPGSDALPPIAPLLADANVDNGIRSFRKCVACHTVEDGGANKVGPNLWNIVDRPIAAATGFGYSSSMTDYADGGQTLWDYEHLNGFLAAPKKYIKGTAMGFAGLKKEAERADVIAYLRSLSDSPVPLPDPASTAGDTPDAEPANAEATSEDAMSTEQKADDSMASDTEADAPAATTDVPAESDTAAPSGDAESDQKPDASGETDGTATE